MTEETALRIQIDALLTFIPTFEQEGVGWAGEWQGGERNASGAIQMPYFGYSDALLQFTRACATHGWVAPGISWLEPGLLKLYIEDPATFASADASLIRRLLTTHVRGDRFNEGHLASMVENGHLLAILRRLAVIRAGL